MSPQELSLFLSEEKQLMAYVCQTPNERNRWVFRVLEDELRSVAKVLIPFALYSSHSDVIVGVWEVGDDYLVYAEVPETDQYVLNMLNDLPAHFQLHFEAMMERHLLHGQHHFPFCVIEGGRGQNAASA